MASFTRTKVAWFLPMMFGLAACGSASDVSSSEEGVPLAADGNTPPLLVNAAPLADGEDGGDGADVQGVLVLEGECLFIDDSVTRFPIVWPNGTDWDATNQIILLNDGQTAAIGQSILGVGGYPGADSIEDSVGTDAAVLAAECVDNDFGEVAMLNNTSEPLVVIDN